MNVMSLLFIVFYSKLIERNRVCIYIYKVAKI